jgi:hypothetical protein
MIKDLIDDHRVFNAGDDFDGTAAFGAGFDAISALIVL